LTLLITMKGDVVLPGTLHLRRPRDRRFSLILYETPRVNEGMMFLFEAFFPVVPVLSFFWWTFIRGRPIMKALPTVPVPLFFFSRPSESEVDLGYTMRFYFGYSLSRIALVYCLRRPRLAVDSNWFPEYGAVFFPPGLCCFFFFSTSSVPRGVALFPLLLSHPALFLNG